MGAHTTGRPKRDRYFDSLRVLALIMVMTYHVFGWAWLWFVFPPMGIMFALAGSLVAGSLDRSPGNPWRVLKKRGIRLLPPVWLLGLVLVPAMLVAGWTHSEDVGAPLTWHTLLFWVLPISDPPGSEFGADWVTPLWFIRAYLWFLLLSPPTLWLFRHWPKRKLARPLAVILLALPLAVVLLSALDLLTLDGRSGDVILTIAIYGGCWMLGFAHHDNKIRSQPLAGVLVGGASLMALGLTWAFTHQDPVSAYDINEIPMADALYSLGAVLILLRMHPDFAWMEKRVVLDKLVTVINSRAMTIYLWGNVAIFLSNPILDLWSVTENLDQENALGYLQMYVASWLILIGFVLMFGWCEDLAARRPLRINPWPRSKDRGHRPSPGGSPATADLPLRNVRDDTADSRLLPATMTREVGTQRHLQDKLVPRVCLLDPDGDIAAHLADAGRGRRHTGWACHHTDMWVTHLSGTAVGVVGRAVGAPFAVQVAEQMFASGADLVISITSAGRLKPLADQSGLVLIDHALRGEGTSPHYLSPAPWSALRGNLRSRLEPALHELAEPVMTARSWTTDAPYRETGAAIASAVEGGATCVEMEAAALYALAEARGYDIVCLARVTNTVSVADHDFEKGEGRGVQAELALITHIADTLSAPVGS